jgi:DNA polymerase III, delta subunit
MVRQHHAVLWLAPHKQSYILDDLDPLHEAVKLKRSHDEPFFVIIESADLLSLACSNALLKTLEEPPLQCGIILLAQRAELILPTVWSRCTIREYGYNDNDESEVLNEFMEACKDPRKLTLQQFSALFEKSNVDEYKTRFILDGLIEYWSHFYQKNIINPELRLKIENNLSLLYSAREALPMPGSVKLFWRSLFLQCYEILDLSCLET